MSLLHPHKHPHGPSEAEVIEAGHPDYDAQTDLALPHTGHEEEIDAGVCMFGSGFIPAADHAGYDAARDVGFTP